MPKNNSSTSKKQDHDVRRPYMPSPTKQIDEATKQAKESLKKIKQGKKNN